MPRKRRPRTVLEERAHLITTILTACASSYKHDDICNSHVTEALLVALMHYRATTVAVNIDIK